MATRICLLPPDVALALPPSRVRMLRRTYDGLGGFDESDPLAVARALSFRELPERTTEFLHSAVYFASDDGRAAIQEAAQGRRDLAPWLLLTAIDLAIDVARAAERGDDAAKGVRARAWATMDRCLSPRVEYELFAKRREAPASPESLVDGGRAVYGEQLVDGWTVECKDGTLRAVIVHAVVPAALARTGPRARRMLSCDTIRWDAARGRVGLTLARPSRLQEWRVKLGIACAGDEGFLERLASVH